MQSARKSGSSPQDGVLDDFLGFVEIPVKVRRFVLELYESCGKMLGVTHAVILLAESN